MKGSITVEKIPFYKYNNQWENVTAVKMVEVEEQKPHPNKCRHIALKILILSRLWGGADKYVLHIVYRIYSCRFLYWKM